MYYLKLIFKNIFRHRLRSLLTIVGLVVAILAFGLLQTVVHAWYAGADMASANRLITRNATSLVFSLPAYYRERFFATFGVDHDNFFDLYPEFKVRPEELLAFKKDRRGAMVGRLIADQHGFKVGDVIPMTSPIYGGGTWEFTVRGIYEPKDETTVTRQLYFHWDYINEQMKKRYPKRAEFAGVFVVQIADGTRAAEVSQVIDKEFRNSLAETLTETEKAFSLGFVAQTEAIVTAVRIVSFVVIVIIFAVVANTMAMTARERLAEYATLKALGFAPMFVVGLIVGESIMLSTLGGAIGIALTFPVAAGFKAAMGSMFPVFYVTKETVMMQIAASGAVGILAGILPSIRAARVKIVDGLRFAG